LTEGLNKVSKSVATHKKVRGIANELRQNQTTPETSQQSNINDPLAAGAATYDWLKSKEHQYGPARMQNLESLKHPYDAATSTLSDLFQWLKNRQNTMPVYP